LREVVAFNLGEFATETERSYKTKPSHPHSPA